MIVGCEKDKIHQAKMEIGKTLRVNGSLEIISEKCDRLSLEASSIQTSIDSDELEGEIDNVVIAIKLYKICLSMLMSVALNQDL